ncbi:hypothetical protein QWZ08_10155 [Ferruginibacter paludis]|nr:MULTISPECIES: hypothetical protein [Ferruginibacter]MDN3655989.1 hypothetical protein [Ferruginibacter paludis]
MKKNYYKWLSMLVIAVLLLSACNGSRQSMHNHGVSNRGFSGY